MLSCIDSDDTENYALAEDFRQKSTDSCEKIELTPLNHDDIDVALIEEDANRRGPVSFIYFVKRIIIIKY